jgi:hypothetical protein
MGYTPIAVRNDGFIISSTPSNARVLLAPNGSFVSNYSGTIPQAPAANVQSDGKTLKLDNGQLTRYNTNGTIDQSFGNGGSVATEVTPLPLLTFSPEQVLVHGSQIYVSGLGYFTDSQGDFNFRQGYVVVESLNPNGTFNQAFGDKGVASMMAGDQYYGNRFDTFGPDGEIYVADDFDCQPMVWRFTTAGKLDNNFVAPEGDVDAAPVLGLSFARDGKMLILARRFNQSLDLFRVDRHFAADPTFGTQGVMSIQPPPGSNPNSDDSTGGNLVLRDDGEILVGADFDPLSFTVAVAPGAVSGAGSISGRIFNDINSNHKQDVGEPGLAWWQAYADVNNNGIFDAGEPTAYANAAGAYTISDLAPGSYRVREVRQNNWTRTTPAGNWPAGGVYKVTVSANKTTAAISFGNSIANHAKGSLSGTIYNDLNDDQQLDNAEPGLSGWQVYADVNDNGVYDSGEPIATANSKGQYTLSNLQVGGYRLREVRKNGWARTWPVGNWPLGFYDVSLAGGQSRTGFNFGNTAVSSSATATVSGFIYEDINGNGKLDAGETALSGAHVELDISTQKFTATTNAKGFYSLSNIPPGFLSYSLTITSQFKYSNIRGEDSFSGIIYAGQTLQDNIFLQPLGVISGTIFNDANGNGVIDSGETTTARGTVYLDLNNNGKLDAAEPLFNSDAGYFIFDQLLAGTYVVRLIPNPGWVQTVPTGGQALRVTLQTGWWTLNANLAVHQA